MNSVRAIFASVLLLLVAAVPAQASSPFPVQESFSDTTMAPGWETIGDAALTAPTDGAGNGWMRLTPALNSRHGAVRLTNSFPSSQGVLAEFDFAIWGGSAADGLAFFLYDGAQDEQSFALGQLGGSLGYAKCDAAPGLTGAYLGVGFDTYGNFSNSQFCNIGGYAPTLSPGRIVVRGGAPGYGYLTSAAASQPLRSGRQAPRHVRVAIVEDELTAYITYPNGEIQEVISDLPLPAPPQDLKFGFVAGTGGQNDNHEVGNADVRLPVDLVTAVSDGQTGVDRAGTLSWTTTVTNNGPNPVDDATVKATGPAGLSDIEWTCSATGGGSCAAPSGTGMPDTTVDLPDGAVATYAITATAAAADSAALTVRATPVGETGEYRPIDNVSTDSTDLSPVADANPSFTLGANGVATATSTGTWRGGNLVLTRQWQRCAADGTACVDIPGASGATYATGADDRGKTLRLKVTATNSAGTQSAASSVFTLPGTTVVSAPTGVKATKSATLDFSSDVHGATFECRIDGVAYAPCADPLVLTGLADGVHKVEVRAVFGGLVDATPATVKWEVDTTAPETILTGTAGIVASTTATFELSGGDRYECRVDGAGEFVKCTSPLTLTGLAVGDHQVEVRAIDGVGNVDATPAVRTWSVVDLAAEVIGGETTKANAEVTVQGREVGVGCRLSGAPLSDCTVRAYANVRKGKAGAAALKLIGTGRAVAGGSTEVEVEVELNALGRRLLRQNPAGLKAKLEVDALPVGSEQVLTTRLGAVLVAQRRTFAGGRFEVRSAKLLKSTRRWLDGMVSTLADAKRVRCVGHTSGLGDAGANAELGLRRAQAVCRYLKRHGVDAALTVATRGERNPKASNRTAAGRKQNRRVELVVVG